MWDLLATAYMAHRDDMSNQYNFGRFYGALTMYLAATNYTRTYVLGTLREYRHNPLTKNM